jgi:hypothetical protein
VGGVRQIPDAVDTFVCAPDDVWKYHPNCVEMFPDINKLCKVASCWIYIGILLAHPILHISKIRVKDEASTISPNIEQTTPQNCDIISEKNDGLVLLYYLGCVIVFDVHKTTSYEFLLLQLSLLFEKGKCGPLLNVNSILFPLNLGPHQQFNKFSPSVYVYLSLSVIL